MGQLSAAARRVAGQPAGTAPAPKDAELGVVGQSMSPGLAAMTDRALAAVPFTNTLPAERRAGQRLF